MKKTWSVILAIVIVVFLGLWLWSAKNTASTQSTSPVTGTTYSIPDSASPSTSPDSSAPSSMTVLSVATDPSLGMHLVAANGMTLYTYAPDKTNVSTCTGGCATAWPPYTVNGALTPDAGISGQLGTYTRADGAMQLTYNGHPVYFFSKDMKPGDTIGQGVGGVWYVVKP